MNKKNAAYKFLADNIDDNIVNVLTPGQAIIASNNRVLYHIASKSKGDLAAKIVLEGNNWLERLDNTISSIKAALGSNIPYLIVRTYKFLPFVTYDVDLFVPTDNWEKAKELFENAGFIIESHDSSLGGRLPGCQVNIRKEGLLTIDLHRDFTWQKRRFLDVRNIMVQTLVRKIGNNSVPTPRPEVELLLCIADISHERFFVTFADLYFLRRLSKEIKNWDYVLETVKKYGWSKTFLGVAGLINSMSETVFNQEIIPNVKSKRINNLSFPYFLPLNYCCTSFYENLKINKMVPLIQFAYFSYGRLKHFVSGSIPYYQHWCSLLLR